MDEGDVVEEGPMVAVAEEEEEEVAADAAVGGEDEEGEGEEGEGEEVEAAKGPKRRSGQRPLSSLRKNTNNWVYLQVLGMPNPAQGGQRRWRLSEMATRSTALAGKVITRDTVSAGMRRVFKARDLATVIQTGKQTSHWQLTETARPPRLLPSPPLTPAQGLALATEHGLLSEAEDPLVTLAGAGRATERGGSAAAGCAACAGPAPAFEVSGEQTKAAFAQAADGSGFMLVSWPAGTFSSQAEAAAAAATAAASLSDMVGAAQADAEADAEIDAEPEAVAEAEEEAEAD